MAKAPSKGQGAPVAPPADPSHAPVIAAEKPAGRPVAAATRRYLDARVAQFGRRIGPATAEPRREAWEAVKDALAAYAHPSNWTAEHGPVEPLSPEIALAVSEALGELLARSTPREWRGISGQGGADTPLIRDAIASARRYIRAARAGMIADPSPVKAVAGAFGVHDRTVRRWEKAGEPPPLPDYGAAMPTLIRTLMQKGGEYYRAFAVKPRG